MKAYEYIISKQIQWALNQGIDLIGSKGERGRPAYTRELNQNLFEPLHPVVRSRFEQGNGNEISGNPDSPAKMQAVHSSSALGVNVFQYWERLGQVPVIAAACGFCDKASNVSEKIVFEDKYSTGIPNHFPPNIDIVIHNSDLSKFGLFAVECKFSEAYSSEGHSGLAPAYLTLPLAWSDIPNLYEFAKSISPNDEKFIYLHTAQLIKHILGLKSHSNSKQGFKLLYLWYDAFGTEGAKHREEIGQFAEITSADGILFQAMTYQELILTLAKDYRQEHPEYVQYLTERYL
jgi:hypothetical protein